MKKKLPRDTDLCRVLCPSNELPRAESRVPRTEYRMNGILPVDRKDGCHGDLGQVRSSTKGDIIPKWKCTSTV